MSIQTSAWGPPLWTYLHFWSMSYPVNPSLEVRTRFAKTMLGIFDTLPCGYCRTNITKNLEQVGVPQPHTVSHLTGHPIMKNRKTLTRFVFDLHNQVSKMLGKSPSTQTYTQTMRHLETARAKCSGSKRKSTEPTKTTESGCTEPDVPYKACKTILFLVPRKNTTTTLKGGNIKTPLDPSFLISNELL